MRNIPAWQLKFFQNFTIDDLCDLINFLVHDPVTESNIRFCSASRHFCSERAWLGRVRRKIKEFQGQSFLEIFQQFPNFPNTRLLKLLRRYFEDGYISEEWGKKRLPQIRNLIEKYCRGLQEFPTFTEDRYNLPIFIKKEGLGRVKVSSHALDRFDERATNLSRQSLIEIFRSSTLLKLNEYERKKREENNDGEGALFYSFMPECLRFIVVCDPKKYNYKGWVLKTVEVDDNLTKCLKKRPNICNFDK